MSGEVPIACRLSDAEFRRREATLLAQFKEARIATEELPDGYAFTLPGENKWFSLMADVVMAERECCPFLSFQVGAEPNLGAIIVRVTGPPGTKEFLESVFL